MLLSSSVQSSQPDPRLQPVHPWLVRIAGAILFAFGVGFVALLLWLAAVLVTTPKRMDTFAFWLFAILSPIAAFCVVAGLRMVANRPNAYGSLLSPGGWYVLASVFAVLATALGFVIIFFGDFSVLGGAAWGYAFAGWSFFRGRRCSLSSPTE